MQAFIVGGAVRDELLGQPVRDRDWVVVGATPEQMLEQGFRPVGADFPVFLHPETGEEYALARTERKTGHGYKGFAFHADPAVTLEQDLLRRDLTINAMARTEQGELIDPYGGRRDLEARLLRHVSPAFAEDPLRILRVARFAARFTDFEIAPDTLGLMRTMVADGEVEHLVPERVWQEIARGLMEVRPSRMFHVLRRCGALRRLLPEIDRLFAAPPGERSVSRTDPGEHTLRRLDDAALGKAPLPVRWACLLHAIRPASDSRNDAQQAARQARDISERLKAPNDCRDLAELFRREIVPLNQSPEMPATELLELLLRTDALRRPERFEMLLQAARCERLGRHSQTYAPASTLHRALSAARGIDAGAIARECPDKKEIPERIRTARIEAIRQSLA